MCYGSGWTTLERKPEAPLRYTVLNQYRTVQGSWVKEKDALKFIKEDIRANPTNKYYILEAVKEVATETPKLLIEEL